MTWPKFNSDGTGILINSKLSCDIINYIDIINGTVAWLFTEHDVARGILKFQCKTWEFLATSYSVNSQVIIDCRVNNKENNNYMYNWAASSEFVSSSIPS